VFAFFKSRTFFLLIGFLLIAAFIWYAGPYFAFGVYRPLESEFSRLIVISLIVVCWVVSALRKRLRASQASERLVGAVVAATRREQQEQPSAEAAKLRERFEEATAALTRKPGHSLYDLPWYVFIGAPGSGKTTALVNSGLKFPSDQRGSKAAVRGVGGTRNCDWWFTDEAVFLDTAGRYTTQDSDAASDSEVEGVSRAAGQVSSAPAGQRHHPDDQHAGPVDAGRRGAGSARRRGPPSAAGVHPRAADPAAGV
jgi:type VI secretion system protein ImpL